MLSKLKSISELVTSEEQSRQIAFLVAARLTLDQRNAIMAMTFEDLEIIGSFERLTATYGKKTPCRVKAELDLTMIEAVLF